MAFTGNGATLVLTTTGSIGRVISIPAFEEEIDAVEDNDLGTTGHDEYIPGDLTHHNEMEIPVVMTTDAPAALGVPETGTITYPLLPGQATAAKLAGTGFLVKRASGAMENNTRAEASYAWRFDGKTGPAYTAAVAS